MKFISHKAIAVGVGLFGNFTTVEILCTVGGSTIPDLIDHGLSANNQYVFHRVHRKVSHWWLLYVALFIIFQYLYRLPYGLSNYIAYIFLGSLIHILCDALTPAGVPVFNPVRPKRLLALFRTGSISEYIFAFTFLIASACWRQYV